MKSHPGDDIIVSQACGMISELAGKDSNNILITRAGGIPVYFPTHHPNNHSPNLEPYTSPLQQSQPLSLTLTLIVLENQNFTQHYTIT
jgi:hypothetical protein